MTGRWVNEGLSGQRWPARAIVAALLVAQTALSGFCADIQIAARAEGPYFVDLPIYVQYVVTNTSSTATVIWSARDSGAVVPVWISGPGGQVEQYDHVDVAHSKRPVTLPGHGSFTGRVCVSGWAMATNGVAGNEIKPGVYNLALLYGFGTNRGDFARSRRFEITVGEPGSELAASRERYRQFFADARNGTDPVMPPSIVSNDCYSIAMLGHYADWLSRKRRYIEAMNCYQGVLSAGDFRFLDAAEIKVQSATCLLMLGRRAEYLQKLAEIKWVSDEAFLMWWIGSGHEGMPPLDAQ